MSSDESVRAPDRGSSDGESTPASAAVGQAPPPTPESAATLFGARLGLAEAYIARLADTGISHGLIGPREAPRLWERHVLGCAVLTDLVDQDLSVADIGSGAGLPGLVIALRRPDLTVTLVEPLHRRVVWLEDTVAHLGLDNVTVHEGRAESLWGGDRFDVVTARAVARIGTLAGWCLPLVAPGGRLLALKGATAAAEAEADTRLLTRAGAEGWTVSQVGAPLVDPPATVVTVSVSAAIMAPGRSSGRRASSARRGKPARPG